jgi:hypothetical protein
VHPRRRPTAPRRPSSAPKALEDEAASAENDDVSLIAAAAADALA